MSTCKWCGKLLCELSEILDNYCNFNCERMFEEYGVRKILWKFVLDMEQAMQEKDKLGYTHEDKSLKYLVDKLKEERAEVDFELEDLPSVEINKELLHESIMVMLVRNKIQDYGKHAKLEE